MSPKLRQSEQYFSFKSENVGSKAQHCFPLMRCKPKFVIKSEMSAGLHSKKVHQVNPDCMEHNHSLIWPPPKKGTALLATPWGLAYRDSPRTQIATKQYARNKTFYLP